MDTQPRGDAGGFEKDWLLAELLSASPPPKQSPDKPIPPNTLSNAPHVFISTRLVDISLFILSLVWCVSAVITRYALGRSFAFESSEVRLTGILFVTYFALMPIFLAFAVAWRFIWSKSAKLFVAIAVIPLIMGWTIVFFSFAYAFLDPSDGYIRTPEGAVLGGQPIAPYPRWDDMFPGSQNTLWQEYWKEYGAEKGLLKLIYFSACTFFGISYGEYIPVGSAQVVVIVEVFVSRILEIVIVAVGIARLLERGKEKTG